MQGRNSSKVPAKSRLGPQVVSPLPSSNRGPAPEEVVSRARVAKLEAAMSALGHVRPVDERIASSKTFIDRAKKRIGVCRTVIVKAQEALAQAQARIQSEEQGLAEGQVRLAPLTAESEGGEGGSSTQLCRQILHTSWRSCEVAFRICNGRTPNCVRSCSPVDVGEKKRERKQPRNLSHSSLDLVPLSRSAADPGHGSGQSQPILNAGRADASSRMETLTNTADASLRSNRFSPFSG